MELFANKGVLSYPLQVTAIRWGGGADIGKTHVFTSADYSSPLWLSVQCVVDDFGNLVAVPA